MARRLALLLVLLIAGCGSTRQATEPQGELEVYCWISEPGGEWQPDTSCDLWGGYELVRCEHHPEDCWYRETGLAARA